jgi:hypothetical protein
LTHHILRDGELQLDYIVSDLYTQSEPNSALKKWPDGTQTNMSHLFKPFIVHMEFKLQFPNKWHKKKLNKRNLPTQIKNKLRDNEKKYKPYLP